HSRRAAASLVVTRSAPYLRRSLDYLHGGGRSGGDMPGRFGELLRERRLRAGLTQDELAERSGVSARTIRSLEVDPRRTPRSATARELADTLGVPAAERDTWLATVVASEDDHRVPQQLPAPPGWFVGRQPELAALT